MTRVKFASLWLSTSWLFDVGLGFLADWFCDVFEKHAVS